MENISCWILKYGGSDAVPEEAAKCTACSYYIAVNRHGITVRADDGDVVIVECTGTLNTLRTAVLGEVAEKLKTQNRNKIILDLSATTNIYSCAMGLIVRLHKQCEEMDGTFIMAGATGYVKVAIGTVSLDKFIKTAETAEAAFEMMKTIS
jgi:anti-anti-sigma factor